MWTVVTPFWWSVFAIGLTASLIIGAIAGIIAWFKDHNG